MRETKRIEKVKSAVRPLLNGGKSPKQTASKSKGKILLIEDEVTLVELMKLYLAAAGFETKEFCNPIHALEWYELHYDEIDLIVLDMIMPQLHGAECFDKLQEVNPDAAIAICSGAFDDEIQSLLDRGALKFFQKPGRYPTMVTWIAETISMRQAQQASLDASAE